MIAEKLGISDGKNLKAGGKKLANRKFLASWTFKGKRREGNNGINKRNYIVKELEL